MTLAQDLSLGRGPLHPLPGGGVQPKSQTTEFIQAPGFPHGPPLSDGI